MIKKNKILFSLTIIFLTALFLRIIYLDKIPSGINVDEAAYMYDAKSYIETGKDKWGNSPNITISEYGPIDHRSPLYIWLQIPFVKLFGVNEWSARMPAAILGAFTVLITYFLSKQFLSKKVSILASALLAISPWHIFVSRIGLECSVLPFFFISALTLLVLGLKEKINYLIYIGLLLFAFNIYGYSTNKIFIPLFLLTFAIINKEWIKNNKKTFTIGLLFFILALAPLIYENVIKYSTQQGRFNEISIFKDIFLSPINFIIQYISHFSLNFLLPNKELILNSNLLPITFSKIYLFQIIFLVIGAVSIYKNRKKYKILIAWFLLAPVPSALTLGGVYHAFRSVTFIPLLEIITAYGMIKAIDEIKNKNLVFYKKIKTPFIIISLINIIFFMNYYFFYYNFVAARFFEYGHKEAITFIEKIEIENYEIVYTNKSDIEGIVPQNFIYLLIYKKIAPETFQNTKLEYYQTKNWLSVKKIDNIKFGELEKEYEKNPNRIFVARKDELTNIKSKKNILYPNGEIALKIIYNE